MIDVILTIKFVHVLAAAVMFGAWIGIAAFMLLAHRSGNPSVVALIAQFVVRLELAVMAPAIALQPISGFPLAFAIGLSPLDEFWIVLALILYAVIVVSWIAAVWIETRIRNLARESALAATPLPDRYRHLFRGWLALAIPILAMMIALFLLMVWQPRLD
jgi:uncharacterized membrane protein